MGIRDYMIRTNLHGKVLKHMLSKLWSVLSHYSAIFTITEMDHIHELQPLILKQVQCVLHLLSWVVHSK